MGKIDDMRRQREEQFADAERRAAKVAKAPVLVDREAPSSAPLVAAVPAAAARFSSRPSAQASEQTTGKCPVCRKVKPLSNGSLANHQKGLGKACAGSRQPPL